MSSAAVLASRVSGGMERLRVRGAVRFAPGAVAVKRGESLLLDFGGEIPQPESRRVLAVGFEDRQHRPRRVERHVRRRDPNS